MKDQPHLFHELKRRNVVRVAAAYAVVAWLLIEVSITIFPRLGFPDWTVTFIIVLVALGFPLALFLSWAYELTPEGVHTGRRARAGGKCAALGIRPPHHGPAHRGRNPFHLWSETYNRRMVDVFAIQDEIAGAIADALRLTLVASAHETADLEAYDLYLKASSPCRPRDRPWIAVSCSCGTGSASWRNAPPPPADSRQLRGLRRRWRHRI